jgi:type IV fimbrial biogenesis protein FimT
MPRQHLPHPRGLTLVEVLVVIALVGVLIALAAPSMRDLIAAKRVQGITNELVTDMQYARSEAARRSRDVRIGFGATDQLTCYALYIEPEVAPGALPASGVNGGLGTCDCTRTPGVNVCTAEDGDRRREIKTVQVPRSLGVSFSASSADGPTLNFGAVSAGLVSASAPGAAPAAFDVTVTATPRGQLRTSVSTSGRPSVCTPDGSISATPLC